MKAAFEGKFVFEVGKHVFVYSSKGFSYEVPGEKKIVVLPDSGVTMKKRKITFDKDAAVCIEERDGYYLVGPIASSMPGFREALKSDPEIQKLGAGIAEFLNNIPGDGAIADLISELRLAVLSFLSEVDFPGVVLELREIMQTKYPEQLAAILAKMSEEEKKQLKDVMATIAR